MATVTLLLGGRGYSFGGEAARSLAEWIRLAFGFEPHAETSGRERDLVYRAGLLAELLEVDAAAEVQREPYELSSVDVEILSQSMRDYLVAGDENMQALYNAVRRYRGEPELHGWPPA